jgi:hypothetical protein
MEVRQAAQGAKTERLSEQQALTLVLDYYLSMGQRWYGALAAIVLGAMAPPLTVLTLAQPDPYDRACAAVVTLLFMWAGAYTALKVTYGDLVAGEILRRLSVHSVNDEPIQLKVFLLDLKRTAFQEVDDGRKHQRGIVRDMSWAAAVRQMRHLALYGLLLLGVVLAAMIFRGDAHAASYVAIFELILAGGIAMLSRRLAIA